MLEKELLGFCIENFTLGEHGLHYKRWRRGLRADCVGSRAGNSHHSGYVYIRVKGKLEAEHRLVWLMTYGVLPDFEIDHEDGDPSNNGSGNLRKATRAGNCSNRTGWSVSGFKGVYPNKRGKPWQAQITVDKKSVSLGTYDTASEAAKAYDDAAIKYQGEFAKLNFQRS